MAGLKRDGDWAWADHTAFSRPVIDTHMHSTVALSDSQVSGSHIESECTSESVGGHSSCLLCGNQTARLQACAVKPPPFSGVLERPRDWRHASVVNTASLTSHSKAATCCRRVSRPSEILFFKCLFNYLLWNGGMCVEARRQHFWKLASLFTLCVPENELRSYGLTATVSSH